uniref:Uncharacterized protein n=1 Tax=Anguilla anguilla TaxID=7936 RepID=A0A0E9VGI7_ANGAN
MSRTALLNRSRNGSFITLIRYTESRLP